LPLKAFASRCLRRFSRGDDGLHKKLASNRLAASQLIAG
jgi:hypothetical protein